MADGFVVFKDSLARVEETVFIHDHMREQRQLLQERGVLAPMNRKLVFTQDFHFSSPSTTAGLLVGSSPNGRRAWKDASRKTLKAIQDVRVSGV
ncbi:DUF4357 domain-containing protein [Halomonas sp. Mc5H-6]|uniref:DUF4357 domain-containing protein n=1 Tax=Halomonas sp. Mc5H-6 TaxID=2954500 RepID=UPI002098258E|nr:DUF4357 domain-containing protein [Halomonas sp. Mc5H-6]